MEKELTEVTMNIVSRLENMKKCTMEAMTIGTDRIIKGISFYEEVIVILNPMDITEDTITEIDRYVTMTLADINEKRQIIDPYFHYGIEKCQFMMYGFMSTHKKYVKKINNYSLQR